MAKRFRRARKKRFRKKRSFRRKSGGYDQGVAIKVHGFYNMLHNSLLDHGDFTLNWAGNGSGASTTGRLTVTNEFTTYTQLYQEYKVIGVKITIFPNTQTNTTTGTSMSHGAYGSDSSVIPDSATADNQFLSYSDYGNFTLMRPFKRYINVAKYYRKRDVQWLGTTVNYPDMSTLYRVYSQGYANGTVMGRVMVTWFVKFRGAQL